MKKFFTLCASAMLAFSSMAGVIQVQWPADPIDATGADPIELNDGIFVVGNNSKVTLTKSGFYTGGNTAASARHMYFVPQTAGTLTVEATASGDNTDRYVFLASAPGADETQGIAATAIPTKGVRYTVSSEIPADIPVYICLHGNGTITNVQFEYSDEPEVIEPVNKISLGDCWSWNFNVDDEPYYGMISMGDLEVNGLMLTFPEADGVTPEMSATVEYTVATFVPDFTPFATDDAAGSNDDDDIDSGFGIDDEVYVAMGDALLTGDLRVNLVDAIIYILECGPGAYEIQIKSVAVDDPEQGLVYSWTPNEEEGELIGTVIDVIPNDDPTAIQAVKAEQGAVLYNINGQLVKVSKGFVVKNGVKTFVK